MKIGIVTFWQTKDNYGQILQSFALQRELIAMGHEPFLIRYTHSDVIYSDFKTKLKQRIKKCLFLSNKSVKRTDDTRNTPNRHFDSFKQKYLNNSINVYHSIKQLRQAPPQADIYIVGSDQVWCKTLGFEENKTFFLDFGDSQTKRISYAASFGMTEYPSQYRKKLYKLLKKFSAISVREKSGVDICAQIGISSTLVIDPTLLLQGDFYSDYFSLVNTKNQNIFIYSLNIRDKNEIRWSEIQQFASLNSLNISITCSSGYFSGGEIFGVENYLYSTIPEWLASIKQADIVVTTSFHGVVFCLLFHTNFVYVPLQGEFSRANNRVLDLLNELGVSEKVLDNNKSFDIVANHTIDWKMVDKDLEQLRKKSRIFLKESLNK